ncbi:MAG: hypothetical protein K6L73_07485 [Cellvibrionaceae bacterium]
MDKNKLAIERIILKEIINKTHNESIRISDSCQKDILLLVRSRIPEGKKASDLDLKEIRFLVNEFASKIHKAAPESKNPRKRAVVRRSILESIKSFLSDIWPFGE